MYRATCDFCRLHPAETATIPGLTEKIDTLDERLQQISVYIQYLNTSTAGHTSAKAISRAATIKQAIPILSIVQAYAYVSKDYVLKNRVKLSNSQMARMPDITLSSTFRSIADICYSILPVLQPYGLTQAMLQSFDLQLTQFRTMAMGTTVFRSKLYTARKNLTALMSEVNYLIVNEIDKLMSLLQTTSPDICNMYHTARKLEKLQHRKLSLRVSAFENNTMIPVAAVAIKIEKMEDAEQTRKYGHTEQFMRTIYTFKGGNCQVKNLPEGHYTLIALKNGYQSISLKVYITPGETTSVRFDMLHK